MKKIIRPSIKKWPSLIERPIFEQTNLFDLVAKIFNEVKQNGDEALITYAEKYDKVILKSTQVKVPKSSELTKNIPTALRQAIGVAKRNITKFHTSQKESVKIVETTQGVKCRRESRPIEKVGIYIPGGTAPLFSTLLMLGIPANIAGCKEIVLCTPPDKTGNVHPAILYIAALLKINTINLVGGAQAIAAMTYGTTTIPKVSKIFGPGNQYVTAAKQYAQYHGVAIDMPAGPSEVLVIADENANPKFVAADLLSQAEHGIDSQVILLCTDERIINATLHEVKSQLQDLTRKDITKQALNNSKAILLNSIEDCIDFSNSYAPEHLILAVTNANKYTKLIANAGSVFIGNYTCESAGDYASGTNHTLPTNGYAHAYSGVSLDSFVKKITFQEISTIGIKRLGPSIIDMAEAESLTAHANAVRVRLDSLTKGKR
jgi:histidinol dehydrogenase